MSLRSTRRHLPATLLLSLAMLVLAACAGSAASPSASQAPSSPAPSGAAPSDDPGPAIDIDTLLAAAAANDGKLVRVTGNFLADEGTAQLCAVFMESYPPQCGNGVRLTGEVPADTLAALTTTTEPGIKKMWWGYVTLTGTFRASGADGKPAIEIAEFVLVEG
jgi:hypothetical protein